MTEATHPDKHLVRAHMARRIAQQRSPEHTPPPALEQIREQLGWHMLPNNFKTRKR